MDKALKTDKNNESNVKVFLSLSLFFSFKEKTKLGFQKKRANKNGTRWHTLIDGTFFSFSERALVDSVLMRILHFGFQSGCDFKRMVCVGFGFVNLNGGDDIKKVTRAYTRTHTRNERQRASKSEQHVFISVSRTEAWVHRERGR